MHDDEGLETALEYLLIMGDRLRAVVAASHGLTPVESTALSHLRLSGPLTQRHLGDRVGLSTGAVTGLVDRLERHGVCRREPHPTDRRSSFVTLTERGHQVIAAATAAVVAAGTRLADERRAAVARDVRALADAMSDQIGDHTAEQAAQPTSAAS